MATYELINPESPAGLVSVAFGYHTPSYHVAGIIGRKASREQQLEAVRELRRRLDEEEQQLAFDMRLQGATWGQIADTFGLSSRQRAQQKFRQSAGLLDKLDEARNRHPSAERVC